MKVKKIFKKLFFCGVLGGKIKEGGGGGGGGHFTIEQRGEEGEKKMVWLRVKRRRRQ